MNTKNEEIKILDLNLLATSLFIVTTIISIVVTTNTKKRLQNEKTLFSEQETYSINVLNRLFIIFLLLIFLYTNYKDFEIAKIKKKDLTPFYLQLLTSLILITASLISLYSLSIAKPGNISNIENI